LLGGSVALYEIIELALIVLNLAALGNLESKAAMIVLRAFAPPCS
jgi:hypothetical protein